VRRVATHPEGWAGHRPVCCLGRAFGDHDLVGNPPIRIRAAIDPAPGPADRPAGTQAGGQLPAQRSTALDEQRSVNRLVRGLHRLIGGELTSQTPGDLLWAVPLFEAVLHRRPQRFVFQLAPLGPPTSVLGRGLRGHRPVAVDTSPRWSIAVLLPPDRAPMPAQLPADLSIAEPGAAAAGDLLPLGQGEIPALRLGQLDRRHSATLAELPPSHMLGYAGLAGRRHRAQPFPHHPTPELWPILLEPHRAGHRPPSGSGGVASTP
jgi:hypothetical protein